ncbi:hypothetical protein [Pararhodobacter aggregans]|uniref:Uncharacterized protein n=1 Tax=Pararhodobacter aggregans TaxID=404875 RepID=A0A2T7ULP2_9RHOB|nr:hypothetical protein [Pararhodobacter aggregans]PTW99027.1 hypothetical protein C8N33_11812 [Pararhodobacter aggregans]PVE45587.1 hypothetical protein DDE23_20190 [Pararhodobacter aggregans]
MRGVLIALLVAGLLAGCRIAGPGGDAAAPADSAITEQALPPQTEAPVPEAEPEPEPAFLAEQRRLCEQGGGQLAFRGRGVVACLRPTRDAGQRCQAAADCEGLCLARSGSCAPISPLFGCQEVFTARGLRETLCTE